MSTKGAGRHGAAPAVAIPAPGARGWLHFAGRARNIKVAPYPYWFYIPAAILFGALFIAPTILSFYFSLTRWTLFEAEFIGLDNFFQFFREPSLTGGARNTMVYAVVTSGLKVILGLLLATLLTSSLRVRHVLRSIIFFPVLVSTVAVGITFAVLMHPSDGLINRFLELFGVDGPSWLIDPSIALLSVAFVDVWKGVGLALVIFIAGIISIPTEYFDAARLEGGAWVRFRHVIVPLSRNATFTVILLSFIGGLRSFDLIWTMTRGGPGYSTDVIASTIYKQYGSGFYGLATAGNVILFIAVTLIVFPMLRLFRRHELEL